MKIVFNNQKIKNITKMRKYGYCAYCSNWRRMTRDHLIPRISGGKVILHCCSWCNKNKRNLTIEDWLSTLPPHYPQHIYARRFIDISEIDLRIFLTAQSDSMIRA